MLQSEGLPKLHCKSHTSAYARSKGLVGNHTPNSSRPTRSIFPKPNQAPLSTIPTLSTTNRSSGSHCKLLNKRTSTTGINTTSRLHNSNWKIPNTGGSQRNPYLKHTQETSKSIRVFGPNCKRHFLPSTKDQALFEKQRTIIYALNEIMRDYEQTQYEAFRKSREMH
ncbi:hypothetical protein P879_02204 [Paragonimus westermani]|uniref:Uncharacterized protein n=1 Tax=Paragonimus westermani TaxID=34504 RepID=A0A8T0DYH2_9TREM|nr:hypothetical protein P879_02204 [Paragonimus westermani]